MYGLFTGIGVTAMLAFPGAIFVLRSGDVYLYKDVLHTLQIWLPEPLPILCLSTLASLTTCFCGIFIMIAAGCPLGHWVT